MHRQQPNTSQFWIADLVTDSPSDICAVLLAIMSSRLETSTTGLHILHAYLYCHCALHSDQGSHLEGSESVEKRLKGKRVETF